MKVLIVRNAEARTNASVRRVVSALLSDGHIPVILSRVRDDKYKEITVEEDVINVDGVEVRNNALYIPAKTEKGLSNFPILYKYITVVTRWIEDNIREFDAFHAFDLDSGIAVKSAIKGKKKKFVYHIADFYVDSRAKIPGMAKRIIRSMEYGVIERADATIICTEERREQIKNSHPKKLVVVHNSPVVSDDIYKKVRERIERGENSLPSSYKKLKLCYIGMLSKRRLIDTILSVVSKMDDCELILGGSGDLKDMCEEYALKYDNITYLGKVSYEDTFDIYDECNCMFAIYNPEIRNHRYSAANKIYEAMFLEKPIIVAKNTSMDVIVDKYDIGFSIGHSEEEVYNLIDSIRKDLQILDKKAKNMNNVYDEYSWIEMKKRLVDLYRSL